MITIEPLVSQLRECFGRVAYSHKTHEKCSDIYHERLSRLKLAQIILSVVTTGTLIRVLFEQGKSAAVIAAILSATLLVINAYTKNYDLGSLSQKHADTAAKLWEIRESYLSLLTDVESKTLSFEEAAKCRDKLQDKLAAVYKGAPRTLGPAYKRAQDALKTKEDLTFSIEEIDRLLPPPLRKGARSPVPSTANPLHGSEAPGPLGQGA